MAENTKIEWCDATFNPWIGCTKVSPGCDHCYAESSTPSRVLQINWGPGAPRRRTSASNWRMPLKWNKQAELQHAAWEGFKNAHPGLTDDELIARGFIKPRRPRVFCASLADVFDNAVDPQWRADLFNLIMKTPHLDWLLLTKRIGNVKAMLSEIALDEEAYFPLLDEMPLPNVWIGATIVNREEMLRDGPKLKAIPARVRFWSVEPFLSDLGEIPRELLPDWVIVGGESGPGARPMHPDWARSLRDQCQEAGVPFLFKQWGEHDLSYDRDRDDPDYRRCAAVDKQPGRWVNLAGGHGFNGKRVHYAHRVGKKAAGRLLDDRTWDEFPTI